MGVYGGIGDANQAIKPHENFSVEKGFMALKGARERLGVFNSEKRYEYLYAIDAGVAKTRLAGSGVAADCLLDVLIDSGALFRKQLITTGELAELIRMRPQTIAKWRSSGISDPPPAIHLGRQVRYDIGEVMAWVYRNRL